MLILTRREGESIFISLPRFRRQYRSPSHEVRCAQVSLGIDAPLEVKVLREELVEN